MAIWQADMQPDGAPELLSTRHHHELAGFLGRDRPLNLFMLSWLEKNGVEPGHFSGFHFRGLRTAAGDLRAVSLVIGERLVLLDTLHVDDASRLGQWYASNTDLEFHHVVSIRHCVAAFWQAYSAGAGASARLIQDQEMFTLSSLDWAGQGASASWEPTGLRLARADDIDALFLASASMHAEETLEDPLERDAEAFRRHVRQRIDSERSLVWFDEHRRLLFKVDIAAQSSYGVQVAGVYTPPDLRGQGIATRCIFDLMEHLFAQGAPLVTLYVNTTNAAAKRVYTRVGFRYYADYQTVFIAV